MKSQNNMDCFIILSDLCFLFTDAFAGLTLLQKATLAAMFFNIMLSFSYVFFCLLHPPALPGSRVTPAAVVSYRRHCRSGPSPFLILHPSFPLPPHSNVLGDLWRAQPRISVTYLHPSSQLLLSTGSFEDRREKQKEERIRSGL